jgi:hypothetical protein
MRTERRREEEHTLARKPEFINPNMWEEILKGLRKLFFVI